VVGETLWMARHLYRQARAQARAQRQHVVSWLRFWSTYQQYKGLVHSDNESLLSSLWPCTSDYTAETPVSPSYLHQEVWAFRKIMQHKPVSHIDVGSHHRFVALLSTLLPVTMIDIRPLSVEVETLEFQKGSILEMPFSDASIHSLSSLCVVEHIGLGRYGDPLDVAGTEKAIEELKRVIAPGGNLYVSLVIDDTSRTLFNACRALSESCFRELIAPLEIKDCAYIKDDRLFHSPVTGFCIGCYHVQKIPKAAC
jgi:hypothetical protein